MREGDSTSQFLRGLNSRRRRSRAPGVTETFMRTWGHLTPLHEAAPEVPPYQVQHLGVRPTVCPDGVRRPVRMTRVTESSSGATFYAWSEPIS